MATPYRLNGLLRPTYETSSPRLRFHEYGTINAPLLMVREDRIHP